MVSDKHFMSTDELYAQQKYWRGRESAAREKRKAYDEFLLKRGFQVVAGSLVASSEPNFESVDWTSLDAESDCFAHNWIGHYRINPTTGCRDMTHRICLDCGAEERNPNYNPDSPDYKSHVDPAQASAKDTPSVDALWGRYTIFSVDGEHREPYMTRYWFGRLRLHVFHRGDNDPDPHDHPWDFWTFPLTGYVEEVTEKHVQTYNHGSGAIINPPIVTYSKRRQIVRAFRPHFRPAMHTHRVLGRVLWRHDVWNNPLYVNDQNGQPHAAYTTGKIVTIVWRGGGGRRGFLKTRDDKWCWVPWKEYVFGGGKHAPCE